MRKLQIVFALMVVTSLLVSTSYGQAGFTQASSPTTPNAATLVYDPATGNYTVNGGGLKVTTWEHKDMVDFFNCDNATEGAFAPPFDVCSPVKAFKLSTDGFDNLDFGNIAPLGLSFDDINNMGAIGGSLFGGGGLDREVATSPHLFVVPEPSSIALLGFGLLGLLGIRRKRS